MGVFAKPLQTMQFKLPIEEVTEQYGEGETKKLFRVALSIDDPENPPTMLTVDVLPLAVLEGAYTAGMKKPAKTKAPKPARGRTSSKIKAPSILRGSPPTETPAEEAPKEPPVVEEKPAAEANGPAEAPVETSASTPRQSFTMKGFIGRKRAPSTAKKVETAEVVPEDNGKA